MGELLLGKEIGRTCHETYAKSTTGLGAGGYHMSGVNDFSPAYRDYVLRPEAIESWFYLYRHTKDPKYRAWAWEAFLNLKKHCRVENGYAGLKDVNRPGSHENTMETFLLAETFKYLYCIFGSENDCDLRKYVFNTEAHPFPIIDPDADARWTNLYKEMK